MVMALSFSGTLIRASRERVTTQTGEVRIPTGDSVPITFRLPKEVEDKEAA